MSQQPIVGEVMSDAMEAHSQQIDQATATPSFNLSNQTYGPSQSCCASQPERRKVAPLGSGWIVAWQNEALADLLGHDACRVCLIRQPGSPACCPLPICAAWLALTANWHTASLAVHPGPACLQMPLAQQHTGGAPVTEPLRSDVFLPCTVQRVMHATKCHM